MSLSVFAAAAEAPDRLALVSDDDSLTYAQLAHRVRPAVGWLRDRGLAGNAPVALVARNDLPTLELLHALIALGTPALMLHPRLTAPERQRLLDRVQPAGVVDAEEGRPWRPQTRGRDEPGPAAASPPAPTPPPPVPADRERPLTIVQTSGSTGHPRGVVLSRRAFIASADASAANLGWTDDDRWLLPLPVAHVGGLSIVTRCLLARRTVVLAPGVEPRPLMHAVRRHRVTLLSLVPTLLARILDLDPPEPPPAHLRAVLLGGAAASPSLLERAADHGWPTLTTYGLTETCSQATTQRYGTTNRGELGAGPPLPGVELRIGDDDIIELRGPILFSRYIPAAEPPGPLLDDGWFPTGDHGRLDDRGNLHVLGRRTDRIVTGGENVDPVEVEQALERLSGIRAACVFGIPDEEWGEVVCAALVAEDEVGEEPTAEDPTAEDPATIDSLTESIRGLRTDLAPFKLPRRIVLIPSLPTNATGKVDRRETAQIAVEVGLRPVL